MMHTRKYRNLSSAVALLVFMLACLYSVSAYSRDSVMRLENNQFADPEAAFEEFSMVDEEEMSNMRGGLKIGSLNVEFGVRFRTLIDGDSFETAYRLTDTGFELQSTNEIIAASSLAKAPADSLIAPSGQRSNKVIIGNGLGQSIGDVATGNLDLNSIGDTNGIISTDAEGKTTIALHQVTGDRLFGFLVTDANNKVIEFNLDIDITVTNFNENRAQILDTRRSGILSRAVSRNLLK